VQAGRGLGGDPTERVRNLARVSMLRPPLHRPRPSLARPASLASHLHDTGPIEIGPWDEGWPWCHARPALPAHSPQQQQQQHQYQYSVHAITSEHSFAGPPSARLSRASVISDNRDAEFALPRSSSPVRSRPGRSSRRARSRRCDVYIVGGPPLAPMYTRAHAHTHTPTHGPPAPFDLLLPPHHACLA
jgi:hypothetical protein